MPAEPSQPDSPVLDAGFSSSRLVFADVPTTTEIPVEHVQRFKTSTILFPKPHRQASTKLSGTTERSEFVSAPLASQKTTRRTEPRWYKDELPPMPRLLCFETWWNDNGQRTHMDVDYDTVSQECIARTHMAFHVKVLTKNDLAITPWDLHVGATLHIMGKKVVLKKALLETQQWLDAVTSHLLSIKRALEHELLKFKPVQTLIDPLRGGPARSESFALQHHPRPLGAKIHIRALQADIQSLSLSLRQFRPDGMLPAQQAAVAMLSVLGSDVNEVIHGPRDWSPTRLIREASMHLEEERYKIEMRRAATMKKDRHEDLEAWLDQVPLARSAAMNRTGATQGLQPPSTASSLISRSDTTPYRPKEASEGRPSSSRQSNVFQISNSGTSSPPPHIPYSRNVTQSNAGEPCSPGAEGVSSPGGMCTSPLFRGQSSNWGSAKFSVGIPDMSPPASRDTRRSRAESMTGNAVEVSGLSQGGGARPPVSPGVFTLGTEDSRMGSIKEKERERRQSRVWFEKGRESGAKP